MSNKNFKLNQSQKLADVKPGDSIIIGNYEFIVLEHFPDDTTAVITKYNVTKMPFGNKSNYRFSNIREFCLKNFYPNLVKSIGKENIITHKVSLMCDDRTFGFTGCWDEVSVITTELYRKYRMYFKDSKKSFWTTTPLSHNIPYLENICYINNGAVLSEIIDLKSARGIRPFCILNSSIKVNLISKKIGEVKVGEKVFIGDNKYIVLEHKITGTLVIADEPVSTMSFGNTANYITSRVRDYCKNQFYNKLINIVGKDNVLPHHIRLLCEDGTINEGNNEIDDKVSLLTTHLYRKFRKFIPPIAIPWLTATSMTFEGTCDIDRNLICYVDHNGYVKYDYCSLQYGIRPIFVLKSDTMVAEQKK